LHVRNAVKFLINGELTKDALLKETRKPYFVLEGTALQTQLFNFQNEKERIGIIVDEYGDIQGIVTLEDILEEIVGEFTSDVAAENPEILQQNDGSFLIDGTALLRDINRSLRWDMPITGPKTLNGFVLENLETLPDSNLCLQVDRYQIETIQIKDNMIKLLKIRLIRPLEASA
jgi:Mg2+/Co2+ transporter CorB